MEILGYAASLLIGLSLGLIGGGGSILTVPVLVYLFHVDPLTASSYSLIVVGAVSLVGFIGYSRTKQVAVKSGLLFGLSSILTVFLTRHFILPAIPTVIFTRNGFNIYFSSVTMIVFALLMMAAALPMIAPEKKATTGDDDAKKHPSRLLIYGTLIGLITGFLGAGGGFLLIPALIFFARLPVKIAVGTSLMIITLNSLFGIAGDLGHIQLETRLIIPVTALAITGLVAGLYLNRFINPSRLKKGFGWFVLAMGIYILATELIRYFA